MKRIRACAIVIDGTRILLLWRKVNGKEYFVFPGGGKEEGETLEAAVAREAMEETSVAVKVRKLLYWIVDENTEHNFYLCSYISGDAKLGTGDEVGKMTEANQYEPMWKEISGLHKLPVFPYEARDWLIEDFKNGFASAVREMETLIGDRRKE